MRISMDIMHMFVKFEYKDILCLIKKMGASFTKVERLHTDEPWELKESFFISTNDSNDIPFICESLHKYLDETYLNLLRPDWTNFRWFRITKNDPFAKENEKIWLIAEYDRRLYNITQLVKEKPKDFTVLEHLKLCHLKT